MEKVKLPREVAEAIEGVKKHADEALLYDMQYMRDVCEYEKFDAPKFQPIWNWINQHGYKEYFKALVNGYEVEQTPEDKVRELFDYFDQTGPYAGVDVRNKIARMFCLLDIKIEGVNSNGPIQEP